MFNCKENSSGSSRFVDEDVRILIEPERFKQCKSISLSTVRDDSPVELYGEQLFHMDGDQLMNLSVLARNKAEMLSIKEYRDDIGYLECRRQIAEVSLFLRLIIGEVATLDQKQLLKLISRLYGVIPELATVVEKTAATSHHEMSTSTYVFFHGLLEYQWYGLFISFELQQRGMAFDLYESIFQSLLEDLIRLALFKYSKLPKSDLPSHNQFYCTCVRNLWIGIMSLAMSGSKQLDFWAHMDKAFGTIQQEITNITPPVIDFLFIAWFMNGICSLYQYCALEAETFKESPVIVISPDYTLLDRALKEVIQGDKSEEKLRIFLILLKPIYTKWWPLKHDFLFPLWEYFSKRLNSPYQLASESLSKLACICRSPTGLIEQARRQADQQAFDTLDIHTSSFKCFLTIVAFMVRRYSDNNQKTKVQILFNRTVLKLAPAKLELLTEQGIYNYSLLMLTLLESTPYQDDYQRLSKQILHFKLIQPSPDGNIDSTIRRITMIVLANTALIMHFSLRNFDKAAHLQQFLNGINDAWMMYGSRLQPALQVLADAMRAVYDSISSGGRQLDKGDVKFVGDWLATYLKGCSIGERDALFQTINRLFNCLRSKQPFHVQDHSDILQPLFNIVLPFGRNAFSKVEQLCPIITELAAHFTLLCTGQQYAEPFLTSFANFADNVDASPSMRLSYIKLIIASNRVNEIEEKLIIKCWLKLAILTGTEQLTELSQVVLRLSEFRSLCEIPFLDLEEGEEPIGLFFKFVGTKYKEYEGSDCDMRYDMTIKMHALFQQFDKWVPNPSVVLLKRIMSVLALALKECGTVIYIRNNPTCLYHLAFNNYFLPMAVLTDRNVPNDLILAMGKMWFRIMDALGQMNYDSDPVISGHVSNMIVKWAPQFFKFKGKNDIARPYVMFISSMNEPFIAFAFNRYLLAYVELQMGTPKMNAEVGLKLLLYTLDVLHSIQDNGKIAFFIRLTATSIMDHATNCHDVHPSKAVAISIIFKMLDCARGSSNLIRLELKNSLVSYTERHLSKEAGNYFRFMSKLAEKNPEFIQSIIPTVRKELLDTERLRGGEDDNHLRRLLLQLEGAVEANISKQIF